MPRLWKLKHRKTILTDFYVLDTETGIRDSEDPNIIHWALEGTPERFIFGVLYGFNYCRVIYSLEEFIEVLKEPRFKGKKIFAHNFGKYDGLVMFGNLIEFDPHSLWIGSRFICASNGVCTFADSVNIFVGLSVAEIGRMMGNPKQTLGDKNYTSNWNNPEEKARDVNYCIIDCQILWDALFEMFDFAGDIKLTQASLSLAYFRRYHLGLHLDYSPNVSYFWQSYFGGRCEAFKIGKTQSKVIDVNSMYVYAMKHCVFPNPKHLKVVDSIRLSLLPQYLEAFEGCLHCEVFHPKTTFGFLPYKTPAKNKELSKLIFPTGTFTGWFNFNELRFAIETGGIKVKKVFKMIYAPRMKSPFVSFCDKLTELKLKAEYEGNEFERDRAKRFGNSLYGKFAQRNSIEQIYIKDVAAQWDEIIKYRSEKTYIKIVPFSKTRSDAYLLVSRKKDFFIPHSIPSFASYVTSFARLILLKKLISMEAFKPVYCDTDSIFFENDLGVENDYNLGGWKIEPKLVTEIRGLKNYKFTKKGVNHWRVKGVPFDRGKTITLWKNGQPIEVQKVLQTSDNSFEYYNLMGTKEGLRRNLTPGIMTKRAKTIKGTYDKRKVFNNGETEPIKII